MNIECFRIFNFSNKLDRYLIETPVHIYNGLVNLQTYTVQKSEEMRLDMVIESIYGDLFYYKDADIILYINGIDNPLNIREGQVILYPPVGDLDSFRYSEEGKTPDDSIKSSLGVVNKSTRVDKNRSKFVESDYSLPPVVLSKTEQPIKIDANSIIVGGIK